MKYLIYVFLVVITNPYEGIDYNKINSYDTHQEYCNDCISVWSADGFNEPEINKDESEEYIPGTHPFLDLIFKR